jgi:hypothetical protein
MTSTAHVYEVHPRRDKRGVDLISNALPFGRLWYGEPDTVSTATGYAKFYSRSHDAVIRFYDEAGNMIERRSTRGLQRVMNGERSKKPPHCESWPLFGGLINLNCRYAGFYSDIAGRSSPRRFQEREYESPAPELTH